MRRRTTRLLSILLALCMVLALLPSTYAADSTHPFIDVNASDWYSSSVQYVYEHNMMNGTSDTMFSPDTPTSRGMIVTILHRIEETPSASGVAFADVPSGQWYTNAVAWASANNIVSGYGNGNFGPDNPITREQMAAILYRYAQYKEYDTTIMGSAAAFSDGEQISSYAVDAVNWAIGAGLIQGVGNNTLSPAGGATRAQAATILMRFCEDIVSSNEEPTAEYYTVTFEYNYGNKGTYDTVTVEHGKTVNSPANPTRSGYTFNGWYTAASGGNKFDFSAAVTSDLTLYAHWTSASTGGGGSGSGGSYTPSTSSYTVSFYMNDGTDAVHTTVTVTAGNKVSTPAQPARSAYSFNGWYTDAATTEEYNFSSAVTGNLALYAKWEAMSANDYYTNNGDLLEIIKADESNDVLNETEAKTFLDSRGLGDNAISYEYSITGNKIDETAVTEGSSDQHPMYQTVYMSENEETWIIYVINGSIFAYPVSFGLESDLGVELIFSESNTLTSYDDETNQFYVTIPFASVMIVETVETINAETLDSLTIEEICRLSGATVPAAMREADYGSVSAAMLSNDNPYVSEAEASIAARSSGDPFIVVSLGDSYSAGEGIEEFYGQNLPLEEKVRNYDWLAHRSTLSWPGQIRVPGVDNDFVGPIPTLSLYRVPYGERGNGDIQWYFGAVSGAQTRNFDYNANDKDTKNGQQKKDYNKKDDGFFGTRYKDTAWLPNQMDIFGYIDDLDDVDYVTLTIGGNDVDFVGVIATCFEPTYLEFGNNFILENKLNTLWNNIGSTMEDIEKVYEKIHNKVPYASIIVAGYPKLLEKNGKGTIFSKNEATLVNDKVHAFNLKIKELVEACEYEFNTYFVDVETEFDKDGGHQANSRENWLNPLSLIKQDEDLEDGIFGVGPSAYSIHPNEEGARAYARCVNAKIEELESRKANRGSNIAGVITIADTDTDMTNNLPLEGALVTIEYASFMDFVATSDEHGQYQIQNVPAGTYRLTVTKDGYIPVTEMIVVPEDGSEVIYNVAIEAISEGYSGVGRASGMVYDVGTGLGVSGLTLNIYRGIGISSGDVALTTQTTDSGRYETIEGLEAGNYTVVVVDERSGVSNEERYTTTSFNIKVLGGITIDNQNGYVSNGVTSGNIRIVLTWGATPRDLDSHLVGPTSESNKFHVYYSNMTYGSEVELDVDDTSSYGPETITIRSINDGVYTYAVHNYSDSGSLSSTSLSTSGAKVQVYRGTELIMTYNVPSGRDGTLWTVFSYDSNTQRFTTINDMSYDSSDGGGVLQGAAYEASPQSDTDSVYDAYVVEVALDLILSNISANSKQP